MSNARTGSTNGGSIAVAPDVIDQLRGKLRGALCMPGEPGYSLLTNFNLLYILGAFYAALGIRAWSRRSWLHGLVIAFLPMVLFFGCWTLVAMARS